VALFFDKSWFETRMNERNITRNDLASGVGISREDVDAMFKDQMEVSASQVETWALLLGQTPAEVALRCGVSTREAEPTNDADRIQTLESRIAALEGLVAQLAKQLDEERQPS
jgi:transcriptional regulator with XRE-family HTH domain